MNDLPRVASNGRPEPAKHTTTLLVTFDYPPMVGGIATVFGTLWSRAGRSCSLILAPNRPGAAAFDAERDVPTFRYPSVAGRGLVAKVVNTLSCGIWFVFLACRYRPEVVIAGQIRRAGALAYCWSSISGRPYDLWVYGGEASPGFTSSRRLTRFLHRILAGARHVFTISAYTSRTMLDFGIPENRVIEIPLAARANLAPAPKDPGYTARLGLEGALVYLTVGRLIARKGIDTMLEALAGIDERLPAWRYLIVSDGPYRDALERLSRRLGLDEKVTFTGLVDDAELAVYYNLCDVFAMPNREVAGEAGESLSVEGFGMVLLDAAACGKPVIAGRSGGAVDAVEDGVNGLLVEPGDVGSLQAALLELADDRRRTEMGRAGIDFAQRFDWNRSAEKLRPYL